MLFGDRTPSGEEAFEPADSGGACFVFESGNPRVGTVVVRQHMTIGPDAFRTWLNQTVCSFSTVPNAYVP